MANTLVSIIVDDNSPTIAYAPFGDTLGEPNVTAGWNPYYTGSGFSSGSNSSSSSVVSNLGSGTSLHVTACDGAQVAIRWNGTAINVFGTITANSSSALTYTISLDGNATTNFFSRISSPASVDTAANDVLASFSNLSDELHEIVLTVHNAGATDSNDVTDLDAVVAFDSFVLFMDGDGPPAPSASSTSASEAPTTTSLPDGAVSYRGQWSYSAGLLPDFPGAAFHTSTNVGDSARVDFNGELPRPHLPSPLCGPPSSSLTQFLFSIPAGTALSLSGLTSPSSGTYNVTLDDHLYPTLSARASFTAASPVVLFYIADLDPAIPHSLEIVNAGADGGGNDLTADLVILAGGMNVTMAGNTTVPNTSTSSSHLSHGAVAAIAVGVVLGVLILIAFILTAIYWRRRRARRKESFLVNPRVSYWQRNWPRWFSPRAGSTAPQDTHFVREKDTNWRDSMPPRHTPGILQIGRPIMPREKEEDGHHDYYGGSEVGTQGHSAQRTRHVSQKSDGSFSIELPELSAVPLRNPTSPFPYTPEPSSLVSQTSAIPRGAPSTTPPDTLSRMRSSTSPRNARPRGPREMHGRGSSDLLNEMYMPTSDLEAEDNATPLRVEFAAQSQPRSERRMERYVSTGGVSLPQSLRQALARGSVDGGNAEAGPSRPSTFLSFMDFSSSSSSSSRSRSLRQSSSTQSKRSTRSSAKSRHESSSQQAPPLPTDHRGSMALSMTIAGGPTESRPSLSPDISLQPVPLPPPLIVPPDEPHTTSGAGDPLGELPSPSDSIPMTVSDIHFRHSIQSSVSPISESRRTSAFRLSGSHRPPHPPLPTPDEQFAAVSTTRPTHSHSNSQGTMHRPYIMQKLMGLPLTGPGSATTTPLGSPTAPSISRPDLPEGARTATTSGRPRTADEALSHTGSRSAAEQQGNSGPPPASTGTNLSFGSRSAFGFLGRR
ncbi:uncharacterized protein C8Q71DRAFT_703803 [Rhodofomes roseus]|uniref:Uncharacterized protein n=1 Tax=Rhodofomes roseus TaxID=34475 RepID=A0ABQ8KLM0_9APHY|nr:uncharacterized protein C8Q71DRAFT_703803 [Rhodofomes roseus]KAH9839208.1 hypothetical protein C8Q71DRAFT_703803 [Rhodofomes roseus]